MKIERVSKEIFDAYALNHQNANMWQSVDMATLKEKSGFSSEFVVAKQGDEIVAACYLSIRFVVKGYKLYSAPRGFLIDYKDTKLLKQFILFLKKYIKENKGISLRFDPYVAYVEHNLDGSVKEDGYNNKDVYEAILSTGAKHDGFLRGIDLHREPRWIYCIDLQKDEKQLLASFERKCKRSVQKVVKYNVQTKILDKNQLHEFIDVMKHTSKRRDFDNRSDAYYYNVYDTFVERGHAMYLSAVMNIDDYLKSVYADKAVEEDTVKICEQNLQKNPNSSKMNNKLQVALNVIASYDKQISQALQLKEQKGNEIVLSSGIFFTYGKEILCLFSGVYEDYMQFASPYAMHYHMMKYGIANNYTRYNLYGISGVFDKSAEDYGVYEFKKGFHGEVIELLGDFTLICNPFMYRLYKFAKRVKR